jgi:hypothetical protein
LAVTYPDPATDAGSRLSKVPGLQMSIAFECRHCGKTGQAPDKLAGTLVQCPGCGGAVAIPHLEPSTGPPPEVQTRNLATAHEPIRERNETNVPVGLAPSNHHTEARTPRDVRITDISMPFGSMVVFMVKWMLASIPALAILFVLFLIALLMLQTFFSGLGWLVE